jgi:hypothetical protein
MESENYLVELPAELLTAIFCSADSFTDVFALAAACRGLRSIWTENIAIIYRYVAARSIECEPQARQFLASQRGVGSLDILDLSTQDVFSISRNARVVEKGILEFENRFAKRVKCKFFQLDLKYLANKSAGAKCLPMSSSIPCHTPVDNLTRRERVRFIRTYYLYWELIKMEDVKWAARLISVRSKELFYIGDLSTEKQNIGDEVSTLPPRPTGAVIYSMGLHRSGRRNRLDQVVMEHFWDRYFQVHGVSLEDSSPDQNAFAGSCLPDKCFLDHAQLFLKKWFCLNPNTKEMKEDLWDESSDDEA